MIILLLFMENNLDYHYSTLLHSILLILYGMCNGIFKVPKMRSREVYQIVGDVNIGIIMGIRQNAEFVLL